MGVVGFVSIDGDKVKIHKTFIFFTISLKRFVSFAVYNMAKFRNVVAGTTLNNWWDNGRNQIAFCRGGKGFIAINNDNTALTQTLQVFA